MSEAKWTLKINEQFKVVAIPLKSKIPSVAYFIQEADRAGSLDVERAKQLGVLDSKMYGRLKEGGFLVICFQTRNIWSNSMQSLSHNSYGSEQGRYFCCMVHVVDHTGCLIGVMLRNENACQYLICLD